MKKEVIYLNVRAKSVLISNFHDLIVNFYNMSQKLTNQKNNRK